ncbi:M14 family zinc carboxypeptidase [Paenibacillus sp. GYB003]|uniref:M14 family zinc carboxypeptidase n=1 Tax=Paenibacillus sp. GYB003 TaxID=2994392 RepID=UPI002F963866
MIGIRSDYPGGNIKAASAYEGSVVKLEQDMRDSAGWWFYWNFCARCEEGREVVFEFTNGEVIGPWGPACSFDGLNWTWLGEQSMRGRQSFVYRFGADRPEVYFAFALPYQLSHFEHWIGRIGTRPFVRLETLCLSEQQREVPLLLLGSPDTARRHMFFSSRHHACEAAASYVLEGLLEEWLGHTASAEWLHEWCIHVVPFADIDGVENGDQGKGRAPHDHNRDYIDKPIYASTGAIMQYASALRPDIAVDFHCPYKWGDRNDHVFIVKTGTEADRRIERLSLLLQRHSQEAGGIVHDPKHNIEKGEDWNQPNPTCAAFMLGQRVPMAFSMEIPYFGVSGMRVTADSLRRFGGVLAMALQAHIQNDATGAQG